VPERMCLGCGRRAPQSDLVRFTAVLREGALVVVRDQRGDLGGRGLCTCRARECVQRALERRAFARGARAQVTAGAGLVDEVGDGTGVSS